MMKKERLARLLDDIAEGDLLAQEQLLAYIMRQSTGIQELALEALNEGGDETYQQLMLTLADDPELVRLTSREREPLDKEALSQVHLIGQMSEREWWEKMDSPSTKASPPKKATSSHDQATLKPLMIAIQSSDRKEAGAAVEALQQIGTPAIPALIAAMPEADELARWHIARVLSTIANEQAVPALLTALQDNHSGIRWLAAEGLAHAGRATLVPLFRQLAEEKSSVWVRHGAWHILRKIVLPDEEQQHYYKQLAAELKRSSPAIIPNLARKELRRLGEEA